MCACVCKCVWEGNNGGHYKMGFLKKNGNTAKCCMNLEDQGEFFGITFLQNHKIGGHNEMILGVKKIKQT